MFKQLGLFPEYEGHGLSFLFLTSSQPLRAFGDFSILELRVSLPSKQNQTNKQALLEPAVVQLTIQLGHVLQTTDSCLTEQAARTGKQAPPMSRATITGEMAPPRPWGIHGVLIDKKTQEEGGTRGSNPDVAALAKKELSQAMLGT